MRVAPVNAPCWPLVEWWKTTVTPICAILPVQSRLWFPLSLKPPPPFSGWQDGDSASSPARVVRTVMSRIARCTAASPSRSSHLLTLAGLAPQFRPLHVALRAPSPQLMPNQKAAAARADRLTVNTRRHPLRHHAGSARHDDA